MLWRKRAIKQFAAELAEELALCHASITGKNTFDRASTRCVEFLDTKQSDLEHAGLLLRNRYPAESSGAPRELTLKCRSADPFVAIDTPIKVNDDDKVKSKLEEDIAAPFTSRLSRSATISTKKKPPARFGDIASFFPNVGSFIDLDKKAALNRVNGLLIREDVYTGPTFELEGLASEVALIFWYRGTEGRLALVEFSFRYKVSDGRVPRPAALAYMNLFQKLQSTDWAATGVPTKTSYMYRTSVKDSTDES